MNKPFELSIENFQIIKEASLTFPPGLTVIVGQTNNGKSAIFRSLEAGIYNRGSNNHIQIGEDSCTVDINYKDQRVVWKRGSKSEYNLNGQIMRKIGRGQPEEIGNALNIKEIEMLRSKERINFWKQMKFPFLLDKTPGEMFEFMALSSEEKNLTLALKEIKKSCKEMDKAIKYQAGGIDSLKLTLQEEIEELKKLEGIEVINEKVQKLIKEGQHHKKLTDLTHLVRAQKQDFKKLSFDIAFKETPYRSLKNFIKKEGVNVALLSKLGEIVDKIKHLESVLSETNSRVEKCSSYIFSVPLATLGSNLETVKKKEQDISLLNRVLQNIHVIKVYYEVTESELNSANALSSKYSGLEHLQGKIENIKSLSEYGKSLSNAVKQVKYLDMEINGSEDLIADCCETLNAIRKELTEGFDICPLCNQTIKEEEE